MIPTTHPPTHSCTHSHKNIRVTNKEPHTRMALGVFFFCIRGKAAANTLAP
jgi:hypothetical protein